MVSLLIGFTKQTADTAQGSEGTGVEETTKGKSIPFSENPQFKLLSKREQFSQSEQLQLELFT